MKVAIVGYGIEGESNYKYWSKLTDDITIVDENINPSREIPKGAEVILGPGSMEKLKGYDLVVRTAGLSPRKIKTDGKIWSSTNEFFSKCLAPIIAITGTKGKGTTSSLIAKIMEETGKKVWLLGNIGIAPLNELENILPQDVVVFEISSFQLWDVEFSPHIAVILPIEPEHLDVHDDFSDYLYAKSNIRKYQNKSDICIFNAQDKNSRLAANVTDTGILVAYGEKDGEGVYVENELFYIKEQKICSTSELKLLGKHNIENACAAMTASYYAGASIKDLESGLRNFSGLPHRLEFVRTFKGVDYYNDSCATAPSATAAAIKSFDRPKLIIIGGKHKGGPLDKMIESINLKKDTLKEIVLIGSSREYFYDNLSTACPNIKITMLDYQTMPDIVDYVYKNSAVGDVVLLSPGCASFDMFKDYYERGNQFRDCVNKL